jgi:hypothetical protein
MAAIPYSMLIK